jgi:hypothetical protein
VTTRGLSRGAMAGRRGWVCFLHPLLSLFEVKGKCRPKLGSWTEGGPSTERDETYDDEESADLRFTHISSKRSPSALKRRRSCVSVRSEGCGGVRRMARRARCRSTEDQWVRCEEWAGCGREEWRGLQTERGAARWQPRGQRRTMDGCRVCSSARMQRI